MAIARALHWDRLLLYGVAALGSIALGLAIAHGGTPLVAAGVVFGGIPLGLLFMSVGSRTLGMWLATTAVAYPFLRYPTGHAIVTFDRAWIAIMASAALVLWPRPRQSDATRNLSRALLVLVLAVGVRAALTTGAAQPPPVKIWVDAFVLPVALFVVASRAASSQAERRRIVSGLAIAGTILAVIGIAEWLFGFELATLSGGEVRLEGSAGLVRISGPYGTPEVFALSLLICLAATVLWTHGKTRLLRLTGFGLIALQGAAIALTLFRAAWVAGLLLLVGFVALRPGRKVRATLIAAVAAVLLVGAASYVEHVSTIFAARVNNTNNILGRLASYEESLSVWHQSPVFGVGINKYTPVAQTITRSYVQNVASVRAPHNSFLDVLAEQGVVGLLVLLGVAFAAGRMIRQLSRRAQTKDDEWLVRTLVLASAAFLIMNLTLTVLPYGPGNAFYAVLLGLGAGRLDTLAAANGARPDSTDT